MMRIEEYVGAVLRHVPRGFRERRQIELDLRSHLMDSVEAGETEDSAVERMGPPEQVAREYLADVQLEHASRMRRLGAFLIDMTLGLIVLVPLIVAIHALVGGVAFPTETPPLAVLVVIAVMIVALVFGVLYFPFLEAVYGQTLGKWVLGICVTTEAGTRIGWGKAFLRRLPFYFEFFWLDALFALFTSRRQRAFDMVARTVVVRCGDRVAEAQATATGS